MAFLFDCRRENLILIVEAIVDLQVRRPEVERKNERPGPSITKSTKNAYLPSPCHSLLHTVPIESPAPWRRIADSHLPSAQLAVGSWAASVLA